MFLQEVLPSNSTKRNLVESTPYGIDDVNAQDVPDSNSASRKVCIIDTGYDKSHEDLPDDPNIVAGKSLVEGDDENNWDIDENGHGTHIAGTIVALGGNNIGVKGVIRNGNLRLHNVKVFGPSFGPSASVIIAAIEECVAVGSNVISMSLGGKGWSKAYQEAITNAHMKGILIFAAAGNSGSLNYIYPAAYEHVTSVTSVDSSKKRSSFSTFNEQVDISAPGSGVLSTTVGNGYDSWSGTSMACPHAAGVAALVWSNFPEFPADHLIEILETTAMDLPLSAPDGRDMYYGHGLINAKLAYETVASMMPGGFCPHGVVVQVEVQTDSYGSSDNSWKITNSTGDVIAQELSFGDNALKTHEVCLEKTANCSGSDYTFTMFDSYGDGMCCQWGNGFYKVLVHHELRIEGSKFGFEESKSLCKKDHHHEGPVPPPEPFPPHTSMCNGLSGRKKCKNIDGCFWFPSKKQCNECGYINGMGKKSQKLCQKFGCTWDGSSCY